MDRALVWAHRGKAEGIEVYNNTVFLADAGDRAGAVFSAPEASRIKNWEIKNNLIVAPDSQRRVLFPSKIARSITATNNLLVNITGAPARNDTISAAELRRGADAFYAPENSQSVVVDRGTRVGLPFTGRAPDVGAFELGKRNFLPVITDGLPSINFNGSIGGSISIGSNNNGGFGIPTDDPGAGDGKTLIKGTSRKDKIEGSRGDDEIRGGRGNDRLRGSNGDDILTGDKDEDFLVGGKGDDILSGGKGADTMIGGKGADIFVVLADHFSLYATDTIRDFQRKVDKLQINGFTRGVSTFTQNKNIVVFDIDGDGAGDYVVRLEKGVLLSDSDVV